LNFRDLGGYTGEGGRKIRRGRVFRSDDLSKLSAAGIARLGKLGVSVAIDLRSAGELERAPNPLEGHPGFAYHHVPLLDGVNSAPGGPPPVQGLPEMYKSLLSKAGGQIGRVFRILAEAGERGAVFHCTAGKDRTGLTAALLLKLCGVSDGDVIADYALSYDLMRPFFGAMMEKAREAGFLIPGHLLRSDPAFMRELLDFLEGDYAGAESYLLGQGLSLAGLRGLKERLLAGDADNENVGSGA
jgi:protein-tyrosine phosphatase